MASRLSKLEANYILLLKFLDAQPSLGALDATTTSGTWPATAGPAPTPRSVRIRLTDITKDATARGLVSPGFKLPCSNYNGTKGRGHGKRDTSGGRRRSKKRARDEDEEDDDSNNNTDMEVVMVGDDSDEKAAAATAAAAPNTTCYPSPPQTGRSKFRHYSAEVTASTADKYVSKGSRTPRTCDLSKVDHHHVRGGPDSDSDSLADLADLVDTPTQSRPAKKKRTMPVRRSRAMRTTYYDNDDDDDKDVVGASGGRGGGNMEEDSDDEFDPFRKRAEEQKIVARKNRTRPYMRDYNDEE